MSTIDMPGGGEYGLPEQVKFGDTNVPKKTTEYYEAPENSRQRPRFGDGEILFAQADTKKSVEKTTAEDEGWTDEKEAALEAERQKLKRTLGIQGTIAEDDSIFIAKNNLLDADGNFKDYTNKKGVKIDKDYVKFVFEQRGILRSLDLLNQEHYDEEYADFLVMMKKVEESRRKIEESKKRVDSLDIEIEESKKRQEEIDKEIRNIDLDF